MKIEAPVSGDREMWEALYRGYADFYRVPMNNGMLDTVWGWLQDPDHEVNGLVARGDGDGEGGALLGFTHYRAFARPLRAATGIFLDDVFVTPDARGRKVGEALMKAVGDIAKSQGIELVRWITADDNYRARLRYDQIATRTMWITYDMRVEQDTS